MDFAHFLLDGLHGQLSFQLLLLCKIKCLNISFKYNVFGYLKIYTSVVIFFFFWICKNMHLNGYFCHFVFNLILVSSIYFFNY